MLNNQQKAVIHVAKAQLGWDDNTYRDVLKAHGGTSSSVNLSYAGFLQVMRHAKKCGFKNRRQKAEDRGQKKSQSKCKKYDNLGHRPGFAMPSQLRKIEARWREAARDPSDQALRSFLKNQFGIGRLEWVKETHVTPILSVIKSMARSKVRQDGTG